MKLGYNLEERTGNSGLTDIFNKLIRLDLKQGTNVKKLFRDVELMCNFIDMRKFTYPKLIETYNKAFSELKDKPFVCRDFFFLDNCRKR